MDGTHLILKSQGCADRNFKKRRQGISPAFAPLCVVCCAWLSLVLPARAAVTDSPGDATVTDTAVEAGAYVFRHNAMGTYFEIRLYPPKPGLLEEDVRPMVEAAWGRVDELEQQISNWIPESPLSEVNRHASERPIKTAPAVVTLLGLSRVVYDETDGAFDPTVGPLLEAWGFYRKEGHFPSDTELQDALSKIGLKYVEVDPIKSTVKFSKPGMKVDFGGIGKGYALDLAAAELRGQGVTSALLHSGTSTVLAIGAPPDAPGWTVRIEEPYNPNKALLTSVLIKDEAFDTSSGTERYFQLNGKRYVHIFDPRTGKPAEGVLSAHAITDNGAVADALGTAFFVMGAEETEAYCQKHPEVRALLVLPSAEGTSRVLKYNF